MRSFDVVFSPRSERHLVSIYRQIMQTSGTARADDAIAGLRDSCLSLRHFPARGVPRPDIGPGVRMVSHRRWAAIYFTISRGTVTIAAVFSRGRDAASSRVGT
ncbi:type II toxin-antitoxin system RelE/ParE family toxin [Lichenibacterium dinghuense]|uniref:type II toxin-antitoxin system RelE/ParE family toxin n=1 Tax=Lichenibacterium dinghuense TaxID=2895977 RepID=UPI003D17F0BB